MTFRCATFATLCCILLSERPTNIEKFYVTLLLGKDDSYRNAVQIKKMMSSYMVSNNLVFCMVLIERLVVVSPFYSSIDFVASFQSVQRYKAW